MLLCLNPRRTYLRMPLSLDLSSEIDRMSRPRPKERDFRMDSVGDTILVPERTGGGAGQGSYEKSEIKGFNT